DGAEQHLHFVRRRGGQDRGWHLVERVAGAILRKKAATRDERGQQEHACLPDHNHRGLHDRNGGGIKQETCVTSPAGQLQAVEQQWVSGDALAAILRPEIGRASVGKGGRRRGGGHWK